MGAVSMREDALERLEVLAMRAYEPSPVPLQHVEAPPPTYPCPNCGAVFAERGRLSEHLFRQHSNHGFYIRVNDTVPADVVVVPDRPWQLDIVPTGADLSAMAITVPSGRVHEARVDAGEAVSVLPYIDAWDAGEAVVIRGTGRFERQYAIYLDSVPDLDLSSLDGLVLDAQEPLYAGQRATWEPLLDARRPGDILRKRYLEGFAELFLGVNSEIHESDIETAVRSYTRAFGQLRVFGTPLARAATILLAFRMDAFGLVLRHGPDTTLWTAAHWYSSPPMMPDEMRPLAMADRGIWIDDYLEGLLVIAQRALAGDRDGALEAFRALPQSLEAGPGYQAKRDINGARLAHAAGDEVASRRFYARLTDHPGYELEAREAMR